MNAAHVSFPLPALPDMHIILMLFASLRLFAGAEAANIQPPRPLVAACLLPLSRSRREG
jgi:hypothetical protein